MKKTEIKKLDKLWSDIVKKGGRCEICGKTGYLNSHHIIGRRNHTLRFSRQNGVALCPLHHTFGTESAHQDPIWFEQWLEENRLEDLEYIRRHREEIPKRTYEEVLAELQMFV